MRKVFKESNLTLGELQVTMIEIESKLDNRPLFNIYEDIDEVITARNSLLFGRNLESSNLISADNHLGTKFTSLELLCKHRLWGKLLTNFGTSGDVIIY